MKYLFKNMTISLPARVLLVATVLITAGCGSPEPEKIGPARQIILLTVDTLRADRLGAYGFPGFTSPWMDLLGYHSVLYEDATCQAPRTTGSFGSMMSGFYSSESVDRNNVFNPALVSIAERFQSEGIFTAAVISNPMLLEKRGFHRGFDRVIPLYELNREIRGKVTGERVTESVLELMPELHGKDFFLWILYLDPHIPFIRHHPRYYRGNSPDAGTQWKDSVVLFESYKTGEAAGAGHRGERQMVGGRAAKLRQTNLPNARMQSIARYFYDGEVRFVDEQIGILMNAFNGENLFNDALFITTADHGENIFDHENGFGHGGFIYQSTVHVPLMIRWPDRAAEVIPSPAALVDLFPTLLEYAGLTLPENIRGKPLLNRRNGPFRPILIETKNSARQVLRTGPYKWVRDLTNGSLKTAMYDLDSDPGEKTNLADSHEQAESLDRLLKTITGDLQQPAETAATPDISDDMRKQLEQLGYFQ